MTKPKLEYRVVEATNTAAGFDGYAATWWTVDTYGTAWKPGAFKKSISERGSRIPVLWAHNPDQPIGRLSDISEDRTGLKFSASIVEETRAGSETMALLRADVPLGMSFGFRTIKERMPKESEWERLQYADDTDFYQSDEGKPYVRIKEETALWEVSPVVFPANDRTMFTDVRAALETDALSTITEAIKAGSVDERMAALIDELVAAWGERAEPQGEPALTPDQTRNVEVALALGRYRGWLGVQA